MISFHNFSSKKVTVIMGALCSNPHHLHPNPVVHIDKYSDPDSSFKFSKLRHRFIYFIGAYCLPYSSKSKENIIFKFDMKKSECISRWETL